MSASCRANTEKPSALPRGAKQGWQIAFMLISKTCDFALDGAEVFRGIFNDT